MDDGHYEAARVKEKGKCGSVTHRGERWLVGRRAEGSESSRTREKG